MKIDGLKKIVPYATLVGIIIGLITYVWADTKQELKGKANNAAVIQMMGQIKDQRQEDREDDKEQRVIDREKDAQQYKINQQLLESVQFLMIKQKENEE